MIPIDSIEIPERFVAIARDWYGGQGCMLYAVCSSGGLYTGSQRPTNDDGYPASDEEWYYGLWIALSGDVHYAAVSARKACVDWAERDYNENCFDDADCLEEFDKWADDVCERLMVSYGLEG